ncbi:glycosyltransferase family 4 protein [Pseudomonas capeferrum]|uniref:glycosyltransferase family 4 protein n=1 Tax=Pseudomonas capeferrum TaxID=1495066 RepID=UPI002158EA68|nr:glycosyltransferase family 4 protein [Pseudomonas capeferrum]
MNAAIHTGAPRILHLLNSGGFYGAERMLLDHCQATPGRHRVLFLDAPEDLLARFREAGVECQRCQGLGALLKALRDERGNRALVNSHNFKGLLFGWVGASLLRLPMVITQHGFTPRSRKQRFYTWLSLQLCRTPTVGRVVCVAESIARIHRDAGVASTKLQVIPNGLPQASALPTRGHGYGQWLAGYVGRLSSEKGPDLFLDTLIPLCQRHPKVHAVMLGEGPERAVLQARIDAAGLTARITLPGFQRDMRSWMARLDALVISSRTEGTPMILLEAMQDGVPVVAFGVGGIPDVIEHGRSGLLAKPLAVDELGLHLQALLEDPAQAAELVARASQTQRERYHLPTLAQHWAQVYRGTAKEAIA